jgi:DNA-binding XRE family transcriptional regulator
MRELRKLAGLYQVEVAPELGLDNETICRWEKQEHKDIPKAYAEVFTRLVNDVERVAWIKKNRRSRRRGRSVAAFEVKDGSGSTPISR